MGAGSFTRAAQAVAQSGKQLRCVHAELAANLSTLPVPDYLDHPPTLYAARALDAATACSISLMTRGVVTLKAAVSNAVAVAMVGIPAVVPTV